MTHVYGVEIHLVGGSTVEDGKWSAIELSLATKIPLQCIYFVHNLQYYRVEAREVAYGCCKPSA